MSSLMAEDDTTGSIIADRSPLPALSMEDWTQASAALSLALDPQGAGAAIAWENPASGARGSITPVGAVYEVEGRICRAFLAEIGGKIPARRLQGRGCQGADGQWAVSDLKPFGS
jgi:surface antigen